VRLARFEAEAGDGAAGGVARVGVVDGDEVAEVAEVAAPDDVNALLARGPEALAAAGEAALAGGARHPLAGVRLLAPVPKPSKFLAIGLNYLDHLEETGATRPEFPIFFNKQVSCVTGPHDPIHVPVVSGMVDYEGELGVVIGRRCRHVRAADAPGVVAGYLVVNDVSVRDWQFRSPTMTLGKSFDTHGPIGPWLVTPDDVPDPHALSIRTWVNGELMQDGTTADMLSDCWAQIELLSTVCTLEPGDIISTGTPAGVGVARDPQVFLRAGDVVRIEIEGIGAIENPVIDEPRP